MELSREEELLEQSWLADSRYKSDSTLSVSPDTLALYFDNFISQNSLPGSSENFNYSQFTKDLQKDLIDFAGIKNSEHWQAINELCVQISEEGDLGHDHFFGAGYSLFYKIMQDRQPQLAPSYEFRHIMNSAFVGQDPADSIWQLAFVTAENLSYLWDESASIFENRLKSQLEKHGLDEQLKDLTLIRAGIGLAYLHWKDRLNQRAETPFDYENASPEPNRQKNPVREKIRGLLLRLGSLAYRM